MPQCAACGQPVEDEWTESLCPICRAPLSRTFATAVTLTAESVESGFEAAARLRPGQLFAGRYAIVGVIGRGGMGAVYRARHVTLDAVFASLVREENVDARSRALVDAMRA